MGTQVYRHFDKAGTLLYVGQSLSTAARLAQHRDTAHWFTDIARIDIEHFDTLEAALYAERKAIEFEHPLHNIVRPHECAKQPASPPGGAPGRLFRDVVFAPLYSVHSVARGFDTSISRVNKLWDSGELGYVVTGERNRGKLGKFPVRHSTGYQIISYLEHLHAREGKVVAV